MKKEQFLDIVKRSMKKDPTLEELTFLGTIGEAVEKAFEADTVTRNKELAEAVKQLGTFEEGKTAADVIRTLAKSVDDLEKKTMRTLTADDKFKLRAMLEAKKDEIIRASKDPNAFWQLEFKANRAASALMTNVTAITGAVANNNPNVFTDMEIAVIKYPANFIIDAIGGRQVAKVPAIWRWQEETTPGDGAAAAVGEGVTKPLTDSFFIWNQSARLKYAGRIEFTQELEMDFDQLFLDIIDIFEQKVIRAWNAGVQALLVAYATDYTTTELDGTFVAPSIASLILAGKLWIQNNGYDPDIVMISPGYAAQATIHQNANGDISYLPENVAFQGLKPFISTNVPTGKIIIGTSSTVSEQHSAFILRRGVYGNQFIENKETIVGEVYSALKLPTVSANSWVELDIATVIAALKVSNA